MKNKILLSIMLMLTCFGMAKANVVQVGAGTETKYYYPVNMYYNYSLVQQIYIAEEIGMSGTITSIAFDYAYSQPFSMDGVQVYMKNVSKGEFIDNNDVELISASDKVWEGTFSATEAGWVTIDLNTPFEYDGASNLLVCFYDPTEGYPGSLYTFNCTTTEGICRTLSFFSDNVVPDLSDLSSFGGTKGIFNQRSNIKITLEGGGGGGGSDVIEIGSGTSTSSYFPVHNYYKYSLTQQIYTKDEIGAAATLKSISFRNASSFERNRVVDIYLKHTDKEAFSANNDWIDCSDAQKVFSGEVLFFVDEWTTIVFDTPFEYNGTDNVLVVVDDNTGVYTSSTPFYVFTAPDQAMYIYSDNTNYDVTSISEYSGTKYNEKNQIKFNAAPNRARPTNLQVSNITYNSATVSWEGEGSRWNVQYRKTGASEWLSIIGTPSKSETLQPLAQETDYQVRVQIYEGSVTEDGWRYTYFTTEERYPRPTDLEVSDITGHTAVLGWTEQCGATLWEINIDGATTFETADNPCLLEDLVAGIQHTVKVRSIINKEEGIYSNWSYSKEFTTAEANPIPTDVVVTPHTTYADISWTGGSESYDVRYKKYLPETATFFEDFETNLDAWTIHTVGGAPYENGWYLREPENPISGTHVAAASSWVSGMGAYDADNWLVSPLIDLDGTLRFWERADLSNYRDEFEVRLSLTGNAIDDFTQVIREKQEATGGQWSEVKIDLSKYAGQKGYIAIHHQSNDHSSLYIDDFGIYVAEGDPGWNELPTTNTEVTIPGLEAGTEYLYQIVAHVAGEEDVATEIGSFTTLELSLKPSDIVVTPGLTTATISWEGISDAYKIRYVGPSYEESEFATIILKTDDVWGDGSGYQMLIDADATAYGTVIPESGPLTNGGDADPSVYAEFEYKIPENADGALSTSNIILNSQASIQIPAGTYDFCITNPTPGDRVWIAVDQRYDDYVFEGGKTYEFYVYNGGDSDATDLTIIGNYDWDKAITIDYATSPYTIEGLEPGTTYQLLVLGIKDGEGTPSDIVSFTTLYDLALDAYEDNEDIISYYDGEKVAATLSGRTYWKDGTWQTICLPFDVELDNSPLKGADVRTAESVTREGNVLIINYLNPVSKMKAGVPYIIRWDGGDELMDPVFQNVTIKDGYNNISLYDSQVLFYGAYFYFSRGYDPEYRRFYYMENGSPVLVSAENGMTLFAFDCYFSIDPTLEAELEGVVLNTGEMSIDDLITGIGQVSNKTETGIIYNVAGQRLSKKQKGINIVDGKKVAIK